VTRGEAASGLIAELRDLAGAPSIVGTEIDDIVCRALAEIENLHLAGAALPRDGDDYPLWLLVATKKALFRFTEDPDLDGARFVLNAVHAAIEARAFIDRLPIEGGT